MAFRFRRRIKIAPGLSLNLGKKGVSISAGVRGAHVTTGTSGTRVSAGVPGTGLSVTSKVGAGRKRADAKASAEVRDQLSGDRPSFMSSKWGRRLRIATIVLLLFDVWLYWMFW